MSFRDMLAADIHSVFMNSNEFAETRTVKYDGVTYTDIPIVLSGVTEQERRKPLAHDYAQGLFLVTGVLSCAAADLGGVLPEHGQRIQINDREGGGGFFKMYTVAASTCSMGMLRVELTTIYS